MSLVGGTTTTYDSNRLREQFANIIYMISPEETPFQSLVDRESVDGKHPEWSTDTLRTPVTTNQQLEGDDYAYTTIPATTRVGNYTEIARQTYLVSRTDEKNTKAGPKSELGRQRVKAGKELKTDIELSLLANKASNAGAAGTARQSAGFAAWITSNDSRGATGTDGGFSGGVVAAAGPGTLRAFSKALLDATILATYTSGGNPTVLMLSPYNKTVFSTFVNISDGRTSVIQSNVRGNDQMTVYSAADTYVSDFGVIDIVPNRQLARGGATSARQAYLIDTSKVAIGVLDDIFEDRPAKTGDADKRALVTEFCLVMKTQAAHGLVADIFGLTASS